MMKDKVEQVKSLLRSLIPPPDVDAGDDEMHISYHHWGPEGQRMETTLIVTDILEEELDR